MVGKIQIIAVKFLKMSNFYQFPLDGAKIVEKKFQKNVVIFLNPINNVKKESQQPAFTAL
jgi:hypothetical protein